jgi:Mn2+/Fe2+ NRAMP family transporter
VAQGLGWTWGENVKPRQDARFCLLYTVLVFAASIFSLVGVDPLKMTQISMSLTAASLPIGVLPFLVLMNDKSYLHDHTNRIAGNIVVMFISLLASVLAIISIPLQIVGSS